MWPLRLQLLVGSAVCASLDAQATSYIAPFAFHLNAGNGGNTIPWWAGSATYQQIHDTTDLAWIFPSSGAVIRKLSLRPANKNILTGRSIDAKLTLGATPITASRASETFAANLGPMPMVVMPYTTITLPNAQSVGIPNPQTWFFPFSVPFAYSVTAGNLCWELRIRNSSSTTATYTDAADTSLNHAFLHPLIGTGCIATGQSLNATFGMRSLDISTGAFINRLDNAYMSQPAVLALGVVRQSWTLPGLCAPFELLPLLSVSGTTNPQGYWYLALNGGPLWGLPKGTIYAQFAFADPLLGFGVSTCSPVSLPGASGTFGIGRVFACPSQSGQGNETATTGSVGGTYGLITGFDT